MNKVNISIDDISPHPHSSVAVLDRCYELIDIFPNIKFTLFIPIAYYRTIPSPAQSVCKEPLYIDLFPDFCNTLLGLSDENFELGYHGLYHGIVGETNNDEFQYLTYHDAIEKFEEMFGICESAGLENKMKPIFRPPAWKMSPDSIRAARDFGVEILALSNDPSHTHIYSGEHEKKDDIVYMTSSPPWKKFAWSEKAEIVFHACDWLDNFLSKEMSLSLIDFLNSSDEYEFCFIGELL